MGALKEQIGQPDYVGRRFLRRLWGPSSCSGGEVRTSSHLASLPCAFIRLCRGVFGVTGGGGGKGGQFSAKRDERRRRVSSSPAQPCVRQRHGNVSQSAPLHPLTATCTGVHRGARGCTGVHGGAASPGCCNAAWIFPGRLLTGSSSARKNKWEAHPAADEQSSAATCIILDDGAREKSQP